MKFDISTKAAATIVICVMGVIQVAAWAMGVDGQVFAFTSGVSGAMIGLAFGVGITSYKKS